MKVKIGKLIIDMALDVIDIDSIRDKTPVVSGNLRDNFTLDLDGNIINPVEYGPEVEFGTTSRPGAFMIHRSLSEMQERLVERMAKQIDRPGLIVLPPIELKIGGR